MSKGWGPAYTAERFAKDIAQFPTPRNKPALHKIMEDLIDGVINECPDATFVATRLSTFRHTTACPQFEMMTKIEATSSIWTNKKVEFQNQDTRAITKDDITDNCYELGFSSAVWPMENGNKLLSVDAELRAQIYLGFKHGYNAGLTTFGGGALGVAHPGVQDGMQSVALAVWPRGWDALGLRRTHRPSQEQWERAKAQRNMAPDQRTPEAINAAFVAYITAQGSDVVKML